MHRNGYSVILSWLACWAVGAWPRYIFSGKYPQGLEKCIYACTEGGTERNSQITWHATRFYRDCCCAAGEDEDKNVDPTGVAVGTTTWMEENESACLRIQGMRGMD